jgi:hypothetical protein
MRRVLIALAVVALAGCQKPPVNASSNAVTNAATNAVTDAAANVTVTPTASVAGEHYQMTVTLSAAAQALLKSLGQNVIVSANYFGNGNSKGLSLENREGQISLGPEQDVAMPGAGSMTITVVPYDHSLLADLSGPPQVNINVLSGVGVTPANKLDCTLFQDNLSVAEQQGVQVSCTAIGESSPPT